MEDLHRMTLNEYQTAAMQTCMPSCENIPYMLLEIASESGELLGKYAKLLRKEIIDCSLKGALSKEENDLIDSEIGDILWGLAGLCQMRGKTLAEIAKKNIAKLASRKERGVIEGNGDNR